MLQRCIRAPLCVNTQRFCASTTDFTTNLGELAGHAHFSRVRQNIRLGPGPWRPRGGSMTETYTTAPAAALPSRLPRPRAYLMCPPDHFAVKYAINPWMASGEPVDTARAMLQWQLLRDTYRSLGHTVHAHRPAARACRTWSSRPTAPRSSAGAVLGARFRHPERAAEGPAYLDWFRRHGFTWCTSRGASTRARATSSMRAGSILAGHGFRTDLRSPARPGGAVRAAGDQPAAGRPALLPPGHGAVRARRRHRRVLPRGVRRGRAGRAGRAASPS